MGTCESSPGPWMASEPASVATSPAVCSTVFFSVTGGVSLVAGGVSWATGGACSGAGGVSWATGGACSGAGGVSWATGGACSGAGGVSWATGGACSGAGGVSWATGGACSGAGGVSWATGGACSGAGGVSWVTGGACSITEGASSGGAPLFVAASPIGVSAAPSGAFVPCAWAPTAKSSAANTSETTSQRAKQPLERTRIEGLLTSSIMFASITITSFRLQIVIPALSL